MSRITFHSIEFKNFKSYGNSITKVDFDKNQLTLISGPNGSGKTSFIEALSYNLFGKSISKSLKASLINVKNKKDMFTRCVFSIGSDNYVLERGEKPSILKLIHNGKEVDIDGDSREFQKKIENEILRFDIKTFTRLICLGYDYIRFFELTSGERRDFIEGVLDLEVISEMVKKIKEYNKQDADELIKYNLLLTEKTSTRNVLESQLDKLNKSNDDNIKILLDKINKNKENNKIIYTNLEKYKEQIEKQELNINILQKKINELKELINTAQTNISLKEKEIDQNQKLKVFLTNNDSCPTCKQNLDKTFVENKIKEIDILINNLLRETNNIKDIQKSNSLLLEVHEKDIKLLKDDYDKTRTLLATQKQNYLANDNIIKETERELNRLKENKDITEFTEKLNQTIKDIKDYTSKSEKLQLRIDIYKDTLNILSESGFKKSIIDNYIDIINLKVNEYLEQFGVNFEFNMDSEYNEDIKLDYRDSVKYENLSAGQKQRLDLSIFLTFREIAQLRSKVSANILILDEILDTSIDQEGLELLIGLLKKQKLNILAISHKAPEQLFDNIIWVKKEKYGFSQMMEN